MTLKNQIQEAGLHYEAKKNSLCYNLLDKDNKIVFSGLIMELFEYLRNFKK